MTPIVQAVVVVCAVALTAAVISTLLSLKRTASRAASVLEIVEREIRPMASQLEALAEELRGLSRQATRELERVSVVVRRIEEVSLAVVRIASVVGTLTKVGRMAAAAAGVRKGLGTFVSRMKGRG